MREKPESVDFPNAASQGAKIGSISQPSPTGNPATIGCVYSCTGAFSFALYVVIYESCFTNSSCVCGRRDIPSHHSPNPFSVNGVSGEAVTVKKPAASDGFFTFLKVTVPVLSQSTSLLFASRDLSIVTSVTAADVKSV